MIFPHCDISSSPVNTTLLFRATSLTLSLFVPELTILWWKFPIRLWEEQGEGVPGKCFHFLYSC